MFEIKDIHLKLLQHSYISWDSCEFGAPTIDPKRPYGNSNVPKSMLEIIGLGDFDDLSEDVQEVMFDFLNKLHTELETVLQICLERLSFETGNYKETTDGWQKTN